MDPLLYVFNSGKLAGPQNRAPFSQLGSRMCLMCYCPSIEYHRLSMCVFFFFLYTLHLFRLALSLSFFIYPAITHIHTDRQTTLLFFFFFVFWVMYLFECHILSCIIMVFCWWCRCLFPYNIMYVRLLLYIFFYRERVSI